MQKIISLNIVVIIVTVVFCAAYYLLLHDNFLHTSISSIIALSHHLELKEHLIVLGLLPVYIAAVIFGTALLGIYLGSTLQHYFMRCMKKTY